MSRGKPDGYRYRYRLGLPTGASRTREALAALGVASLQELVAETKAPVATVWYALDADQKAGRIAQPWRGVYATREAADLFARVIAGLRTGHVDDVRAALDAAMRGQAEAAE